MISKEVSAAYADLCQFIAEYNGEGGVYFWIDFSGHVQSISMRAQQKDRDDYYFNYHLVGLLDGIGRPVINIIKDINTLREISINILRRRGVIINGFGLKPKSLPQEPSLEIKKEPVKIILCKRCGVEQESSQFYIYNGKVNYPCRSCYRKKYQAKKVSV